jgi:hypothetical protein
MKPIRWSAHARKKAAKREVQENEVERTIARPDSFVLGQGRRRTFMRRYFDAILETEMLLRVVVDEIRQRNGHAYHHAARYAREGK